MSFDISKIRIGIVGLGYVGLPLAVEFGRKYPTVGFDVKHERVDELSRGVDSTLECSSRGTRFGDRAQLHDRCRRHRGLQFLRRDRADTDRRRQPPVADAAERRQQGDRRPVLKKGDIVVYESTVYPGATEEFCVPILEAESGLKMNEDFYVGYSPERINPGDKEHTPAVDPQGHLRFDAGDRRTSSTASTPRSSRPAPTRPRASRWPRRRKVIENTQRDVNIALINELAMIFDRVGIDTEEVLVAAGTKWNFLPFRPGLVGGHCIGIDPYYLTYKAQQLGYHPQMILAGRRINDNMALYVVSQIVKLMLDKGIHPG